MEPGLAGAAGSAAKPRIPRFQLCLNGIAQIVFSSAKRKRVAKLVGGVDREVARETQFDQRVGVAPSNH